MSHGFSVLVAVVVPDDVPLDVAVVLVVTDEVMLDVTVVVAVVDGDDVGVVEVVVVVVGDVVCVVVVVRPVCTKLTHPSFPHSLLPGVVDVVPTHLSFRFPPTNIRTPPQFSLFEHRARHVSVVAVLMKKSGSSIISAKS